MICAKTGLSSFKISTPFYYPAVLLLIAVDSFLLAVLLLFAVDSLLFLVVPHRFSLFPIVSRCSPSFPVVLRRVNYVRLCD
jgi:hypothetical protein